jgi:serine/threonine protein kinase
MAQIGQYELQDKLGEGGMGTVYRSVDTRTVEIVAIKQLKMDVANPEMIERFRREGEALRQLNHPNIVKMLDMLEHDGHYYLVMEYVSGGDLSKQLEQKMPLEQTLNLSIDLADALTRAHRLDIIHRDLKPANILIGEDGVLRLTDFGVAHVGSQVSLTKPDAIFGTIEYLPPEAFDGQPFDARGDIWAFGVMLFEMLAGDRPFKGESVTEIIQAITTQPIPNLKALSPELPIALVDLVYHMLERDPQARIRSVRIVGAELEAILEGRDHADTADSLTNAVTNLEDKLKHLDSLDKTLQVIAIGAVYADVYIPDTHRQSLGDGEMIIDSIERKVGGSTWLIAKYLQETRLHGYVHLITAIGDKSTDTNDSDAHFVGNRLEKSGLLVTNDGEGIWWFKAVPDLKPIRIW